jgi:hypothetical protein
MTTKPSDFPDWATQDQIDPVSFQNNVVEPPDSRKLSGWTRFEVPPRQWFNWLARLTGQWIRWNEENTEKLLNPHGCAVYLANQSTNTMGSTVKVDFDTVEFNTGAIFSAGRVTPTQPGKYLFSWCVQVEHDAITQLLNLATSFLYKNGSLFKIGTQIWNESDYLRSKINVSGSCIVTANGTSDFFEIYALADKNISTGNYFVRAGQSATYMSCIKVGE